MELLERPATSDQHLGEILSTTRAIRRHAGCRNMPIIAVTATAMKGDRSEAGAWGNLSKPVDQKPLPASLRAWPFR